MTIEREHIGESLYSNLQKDAKNETRLTVCYQPRKFFHHCIRNTCMIKGSNTMFLRIMLVSYCKSDTF